MSTLRPARPDDAGAIAAIYAPYVTDGTISFETEPPGAATIAARMAAAGDRYPWIVVEAGGAVAGYAYAGPFSARDAYDWAVETTIYLAGDEHGRGLGRRLYGALLATLTAQGFVQAVGRISLPNDPSTALHAALGFRRVGLVEAIGWKGRWIDVAYWQRPLASRLATPAAPRRVADTGVRPG